MKKGTSSVIRVLKPAEKLCGTHSRIPHWKNERLEHLPKTHSLLGRRWTLLVTLCRPAQAEERHGLPAKLLLCWKGAPNSRGAQETQRGGSSKMSVATANPNPGWCISVAQTAFNLLNCLCLEGENEWLWVKHLIQCLAHNQYRINSSPYSFILFFFKSSSSSSSSSLMI